MNITENIINRYVIDWIEDCEGEYIPPLLIVLGVSTSNRAPRKAAKYGLEIYASYNILHNTAAFHKRFPLRKPKRHFYPIRKVFEFSARNFQPVGRRRVPISGC